MQLQICRHISIHLSKHLQTSPILLYIILVWTKLSFFSCAFTNRQHSFPPPVTPRFLLQTLHALLLQTQFYLSSQNLLHFLSPFLGRSVYWSSEAPYAKATALSMFSLSLFPVLSWGNTAVHVFLSSQPLHAVGTKHQENKVFGNLDLLHPQNFWQFIRVFFRIPKSLLPSRKTPNIWSCASVTSMKYPGVACLVCSKSLYFIWEGNINQWADEDLLCLAFSAHMDIPRVALVLQARTSAEHPLLPEPNYSSHCFTPLDDWFVVHWKACTSLDCCQDQVGPQILALLDLRFYSFWSDSGLTITSPENVNLKKSYKFFTFMPGKIYAFHTALTIASVDISRSF